MQICSGAWGSLFYPVTEALGGEDTTRWVFVIVHQPGRQGLTTQVQYQGLHHHVICCLDSLAAIQICSRSIHQRKLRALLLDMKVLMASGNGNGFGFGERLKQRVHGGTKKTKATGHGVNVSVSV